jgi:hypothetical protein
MPGGVKVVVPAGVTFIGAGACTGVCVTVGVAVGFEFNGAPTAISQR